MLRQGIQGISELITIPGLINLDFADVRAVMAEGGSALMSIGQASGDNRAQQAAEQAIHSALLDVSIEGAQGILFNVTGGADLALHEVNLAAEIIQRTADPDANIIFGAVVDPNMKDGIRITVIATGFDAIKEQRVAGGDEGRIIEMPKRTYDREDWTSPLFCGARARARHAGRAARYLRTSVNRAARRSGRARTHSSDLSAKP